MKIFAHFRRRGGGVSDPGGSVTNWLQSLKPAPALSPRNSGALDKPVVEPAMVVSESAKSILVPTKPGFLSSLLGASGVAAEPAVSPGLSARPRITAFNMSEAMTGDIVQVTYDLVRDVGGNAQAAVGTAWTNGANAINGTNGKANGTPFATCAGSLGGNTNGIELSYADVVLKDELVISAATIDLFMSVVDATGLLCTTTVSYNIGAGLVNLEPPIAGAFTNIVTPRSYNLSGIINTWAKYNALQVRVVCVFAAASALANASLDAIEIAMTASKTDTV